MSIFRHSKSVFSLSLLILIIGMLDYSTNIDKLRTTSVTDDQASAASNFTNQTILLKLLNKSDIKDIKKLTSEEVQLLKSLGKNLAEQLHRVNLRL